MCPSERFRASAKCASTELRWPLQIPASGYRIVRIRDGAEARLAALLLEPLSADGLLNWGLISIREGQRFPVLRLDDAACR